MNIKKKYVASVFSVYNILTERSDLSGSAPGLYSDVVRFESCTEYECPVHGFVLSLSPSM